MTTWLDRSWRLTALKLSLMDAAAYRVEFFIGIAGEVLAPVLVQGTVILALYHNQDPTFSIGGRTSAQAVQYIVASAIVMQIRGGSGEWALAESIRNGDLAQSLTKPYDIIGYTYIRGVAERVMVSGLGLVVGMVGCFIFSWSPVNLFLGLFLAWMGNLIAYEFGAIVASLAFRWEETWAILLAKAWIVSFLAGEFLPLSLFPESWHWVWIVTPFRLFVYGPAQLIMGEWNLSEMLFEFGRAFVWWLSLTWLCRAIWRRQIAHFTSNGG